MRRLDAVAHRCRRISAATTDTRLLPDYAAAILRQASAHFRHASAQMRQWSWCAECFSHSAAQASHASAHAPHMIAVSGPPRAMIRTAAEHTSAQSRSRRMHATNIAVSDSARQASEHISHATRHATHASMHSWFLVPAPCRYVLSSIAVMKNSAVNRDVMCARWCARTAFGRIGLPHVLHGVFVNRREMRDAHFVRRHHRSQPCRTHP